MSSIMRIQKYGACFALFSPASFNFGAFDARMAVVMEKKKRGKEEEWGLLGRERKRVKLCKKAKIEEEEEEVQTHKEIEREMKNFSNWLLQLNVSVQN